MCNKNASFTVEDRHQIFFFVRRRDDDGWRKICKYFFPQIKTTQRDLLTCMGCGVCLHDNMYWRASEKKNKSQAIIQHHEMFKKLDFPPSAKGTRWSFPYHRETCELWHNEKRHLTSVELTAALTKACENQQPDLSRRGSICCCWCRNIRAPKTELPRRGSWLKSSICQRKKSWKERRGN